MHSAAGYQRMFNNMPSKLRVALFYFVFILILISSSFFLFFGLFGRDVWLILISASFFIFSIYSLYKVNKAKK